MREKSVVAYGMWKAWESRASSPRARKLGRGNPGYRDCMPSTRAQAPRKNRQRKPQASTDHVGRTVTMPPAKQSSRTLSLVSFRDRDGASRHRLRWRRVPGEPLARADERGAANAFSRALDGRCAIDWDVDPGLLASPSRDQADLRQQTQIDCFGRTRTATPPQSGRSQGPPTPCPPPPRRAPRLPVGPPAPAHQRHVARPDGPFSADSG